MDKVRIAVLVSGGGTNLQALIDAQKRGALVSGEIVLVLSSRANAYALERARQAGIEAVTVEKKSFAAQEAFEDEIMKALRAREVGLIVLAGFMCILSERFTSAYKRRILNVHPSLIPSFCGAGYYGLRVHEAALQYGVKVTGATVHYVNEVPDGGEIILQKAVDVLPGDTPALLQRRVMEQAEWILLPRAAEMVSKEMLLSGRTAAVKGGMGVDIYGIKTMGERISGNPYVGRGLVIGKSADGKKAAVAYFIMGRSENSRNRVFVRENGAVLTKPFDASKVKDPSLIIYAAVREAENRLIVTNGDQTDTIADFLAQGKGFADALNTRAFEPDAPNFTPRISGLATFKGADFSYQMSILKSIDGQGSACARYTFDYPAMPGLGHFLHTYVTDGDPIPTFQGEPERVSIPDDMDAFASDIWDNLNSDNKISLYVRYIDLASGRAEDKIINKNH